jgi:hypothetical protein
MTTITSQATKRTGRHHESYSSALQVDKSINNATSQPKASRRNFVFKEVLAVIEISEVDHYVLLLSKHRLIRQHPSYPK